MKELIRLAKNEIGFMRQCTECYANRFIYSNWFTMVCNVPHCIAWTRIDGYSFWPVKVISVNSLDKVHVRFFGDHSFANVSARRCFLYSNESPDQPTVEHQETKNNKRRIIPVSEEALEVRHTLFIFVVEFF